MCNIYAQNWWNKLILCAPACAENGCTYANVN